MDLRTVAIGIAAFAVTSWATREVVKQLKVPAYAVPIVSSVVSMAVDNAVRRLR